MDIEKDTSLFTADNLAGRQILDFPSSGQWYE